MPFSTLGNLPDLGIEPPPPALAGGFFTTAKPTWRDSDSEVKSLSRVQLFATPWTIAYKAPLFTEFSRQEYCSGLPFPSPGDLPHPGIEPRSPALQADTSLSEPPGKPLKNVYIC